MIDKVISVFDGKSDGVAADSMRQVDVMLNEYFQQHGYTIGTFGVKYAVALEEDGGQIAFTAYSYVDCVKWLLAKVDAPNEGKT